MSVRVVRDGEGPEESVDVTQGVYPEGEGSPDLWDPESPVGVEGGSVPDPRQRSGREDLPVGVWGGDEGCL